MIHYPCIALKATYFIKLRESILTRLNMTIKSHANCNEPQSSSEKLSWTGKQPATAIARPVILASYDNPLPYYNHIEENDKRKWQDDNEAASNIAKALRK